MIVVTYSLADEKPHPAPWHMGEALVTARIVNLDDSYSSNKGLLAPDRVRSIGVDDAIVDTGATFLSMPSRYIKQLGLRPFTSRQARTTAGVVMVQIYEAVRLTVQGRESVETVAEVPDDCPILIGQIPLEALDFVVDPKGQKLIGNPAHGGEQMLELY